MIMKEKQRIRGKSFTKGKSFAIMTQAESWFLDFVYDVSPGQRLVIVQELHFSLGARQLWCNAVNTDKGDMHPPAGGAADSPANDRFLAKLVGLPPPKERQPHR
jgi:hypothetical protein